MNTRILLASLLIASSAGTVTYSQDLVMKSFPAGVCYAGNDVNRIYIPPPKAFFENADKKGGAQINVSYSDAPASVRTAVEYATTILERLLPDDVVINVFVYWRAINTAGVLANASVTGYAGGWAIDALNPLAYYPVTVAEKIFRGNLNAPSDPDVVLNINSSVDWYQGIDGNTPSSQYDLVTVVIHELCHGLGYLDSFNTEGVVGYYGAEGVPMIYDKFIENFSNEFLTDTLEFDNPSTDLKRELTGGQLYFDGPVFSKSFPLERARIYAPGTFDAGSSISHLDEDTYKNIPAALMTPFVSRAEAIHDPGPFTMSILYDIGWINTNFLHETPGDTELPVDKIDVSVSVISDTSYNRSAVGLVWSGDDFATTDTIFMNSPGNDQVFTASIPVNFYNGELQYYFYTTDAFQRVYRSPSLIDEFRYSVYIGSDTVKPLLGHTPEDYYLSVTDSVRFSALAFDNTGIDSVYIEYKVDDGTLFVLGLEKTGDLNYSNAFKAKNTDLGSGDSLKYRIIARDVAAVPNYRYLPTDGFFSVRIEPIYDPVESYLTDFSNAESEFLTEGFAVSAPVNFTGKGLHSIHPYMSPEENDDSINYYAILRYPVKYDNDGMIISFREVVLVEPGEEGSIYGSGNFFDYVILEASPDYGKTWFRLIDGYDSRFYEDWETAYNSAVIGMNSNYTGTESMMKARTFFPKNIIGLSDGDTILIRFRLFSDPFANGWGWAVDDLKIGRLINSTIDVPVSDFSIFPNPGDGLVNVKSSTPEPFNYKVYNISGQPVLNGRSSGEYEFTIDLRALPSGYYIIVLNRGAFFVRKGYILTR